MNINALYAGIDTKGIDFNQIVSNNINNIHVIYIDFGLLLGEFIELGIISLGSKSGEDFLELLKGVIYFHFINLEKNISSPELIMNIAEEYIVDKHCDSFLHKAYYYSIPIFINDIHIINETIAYRHPPIIDPQVDLEMYKYINAQYEIKKYFIGKDTDLNFLQSIMASSIFKVNEHRINSIDYRIKEVDGVRYLYDELIGQYNGQE